MKENTNIGRSPSTHAFEKSLSTLVKGKKKEKAAHGEGNESNVNLSSQEDLDEDTQEVSKI